MKIENHKLSGSQIHEVNTPKNTTKFKKPNPDTIIIHYTGGGSASSSANWLSRGEVKASAHIIIGRDGEVYQLVPFNIEAWHAGISAYAGRSGFNQFSIGIELANAGFLTKTGSIYRSSFGATYSVDEVMLARHKNEDFDRYWHTYTEAQILKCREVCQLLIEEYNIQEILGHDEISPGRKQDPGPAFPMNSFRNELLQKETREENNPTILNQEGKVAASSLNIRSSGASDASKIALPLPNGQKVTILEERNGWFKVKTEIEGWVDKGYIQKL